MSIFRLPFPKAMSDSSTLKSHIILGKNIC